MDKCLYGKTHNQNECFNGIIWERIPKTVYVGYDQLQLGVYDAISHFNIGKKASIEVYQALNIDTGPYMMIFCSALNRRWLYPWRNQKQKRNKRSPQGIALNKKNKEDNDVENEGVTYGTGEF